MGNKMAPNYKIIFMHYLESNSLETRQENPRYGLDSLMIYL